MRLTVIALLASSSVAHLSMVMASQEPSAPQAAAPEATKSTSTPAAEQAASTAPAATAVATTVPATPTTTPGAPKAETPTTGATKISLTAGDSDAAAELKQLTAHGYKGEAHGSEIWFCRKEIQMGSRFEKKVCFTPDQLKHIEADARQQTDRIQRRISGDPRSPLP